MSLAWTYDLFAVDLETERRLLTVLLQLVVIIGCARLFAALFQKLYQPAVVGEIAAGIVLGPSLLGRLAPELSSMVFDPSVQPIFNVLSQIGLVFLLFLIGLEFDFSHLRWRGPAALCISVAGIALPFALGLMLGPLMHPYLERPVSQLGFTLFLGTALCITAIPVLGRIMLELNIHRTRLGAITITAAAVDDACGWILLTAVASIVQAHFDVARLAVMVLSTVAFVAALILVVGPLFRGLARKFLLTREGTVGLGGLSLTLLVMFACAATTNKIGIFAVFGAFLFGAVLSPDQELASALRRPMWLLVSAFFLPIFFTYTGLRTDIGTLESPVLWGLCGVVSLAAIGGKLCGCSLAARLSGFSWRESCAIGAMMNTRALMALIVINLGMDLGVITPSVFCMLVLMALLTTVMTTPLLLLVMRGTELEPYIAQSEFARRRGRALARGSDTDRPAPSHAPPQACPTVSRREHPK